MSEELEWSVSFILIKLLNSDISSFMDVLFRDNTNDLSKTVKTKFFD